MSRIFNHRPSPAMVVALIALFVALGGTGYAAVKLNGKNIKDNSIPGTKVRNRTLTGRNVKKDSLTGTEVRESSLRMVPSATRAVRAARVDQLKTVGSYKRITATDGTSEAAARAAAPQVPMFSVGPFRFYAKCFRDTSGPTTHAETYVKTTLDGSVLHGTAEDIRDGSSTFGYLNAGTDETMSQIATASTPDNDVQSSTVNRYNVAAPNGTSVNGLELVYAKAGTPTSGNGTYGTGNVCLVDGFGAT